MIHSLCFSESLQTFCSAELVQPIARWFSILGYGKIRLFSKVAVILKIF